MLWLVERVRCLFWGHEWHNVWRARPSYLLGDDYRDYVCLVCGKKNFKLTRRIEYEAWRQDRIKAFEAREAGRGEAGQLTLTEGGELSKVNK